MKTLPLKLRKNGYDYTQVLRGERTCIYEQRVSKFQRNYEVFILKISPKRKIQDKTIEARERFPHGEAFGYWAWTCPTYEKALKKFNEIEENSFNNKDL